MTRSDHVRRPRRTDRPPVTPRTDHIHGPRRAGQVRRARTAALVATVALALAGVAANGDVPSFGIDEPAAVTAAGAQITEVAPVLGAPAPAAASIGRAVRAAGAEAANDAALRAAVAEAEADRLAERVQAERRAAPQAQEEAARAQEAQSRREAAAAAAPSGATGGSTVWDRLAMCESSGNWAHSAGRYHGGLQFHPQTWSAYKSAGMPAYAYQASRAQQIAVAERVKAAQGWGAWPACASKLGLR